MEITLLRHAIAVPRGTRGFSDDSKRPLTPEGHKRMINNARGMLALGLTFDHVYSSPYVRARQTADIAAEILKIKKTSHTMTKNLTPDGPYETLVKEISERASKSILLVGHEPHLSGFVSFLTIGKPGIPIDFKKGGICHLTIAEKIGGRSATLDYLLSPSQLRLIRKN